MNLRIVFSIWIVFGFAAGLNAQTKSETPLFTINKRPVTVGEFTYLYTKNHQQKEEDFTEAKIKEYLDLFVNFKLKVEEAKSRGMDTTQAFHKELNSYKEELKKPYIAEKNDLDRLTKETYARMEEEIKASHILITVAAEASPEDTLKAFDKISALRKKILNGEDFAKVAKEFSEDPSAKSNGGSLGYFTALQMVFPFEEAAYHLEVGEISKPIRTKFGYHILKVEGRRPARGEVEVSHILVRGDDEKAKQTIAEVSQKLKAGGDWDKLCKDYSQDPGTKDQGGRLRPFGPGALASAPAFEEIAFSMTEPGSISEPFKTPFGWHIIRLEQKIPLPPYAELEESLKKRVARDERMQLSKRLAEQKRKRKLGFVENEVIKDKLFALADTTLTKGDWQIATGKFSNEENLFRIGNSQVPVAAFFKFVKQNQASTNANPSVYLGQLYDRFVDGELDVAEDVLLQAQYPEYKNLVTEYSEGILLFGIMEKEVWNKASEDSVGQHHFYEENVERYHAGDRVSARIFSTNDKSFLDEIKEKVAAGDTLSAADMKKFKSVIDYRSYEKGDNKAVDQVGWTIGLHEAEADGMYYLVEVDKLVPPGAKAFDEIRANVISDYQDNLEKIWIAKLKNKYEVKMNKKGMKEIMKLAK